MTLINIICICNSSADKKLKGGIIISKQKQFAKIFIIILPITIFLLMAVLMVNHNVTNKRKTNIVKGVLSNFYGENDYSSLEKYVNKENVCYSPKYQDYLIYIDEYIIDKYSGVGMLRYRIPKREYDKKNGVTHYLYVSKNLLMSESETIDNSNDLDNVYIYYDFVLNSEGKAKDYCDILYAGQNNINIVQLEFTVTEHYQINEDNGVVIDISPLGMSIQKKGYISLNQKGFAYEILGDGEVNTQYLESNVNLKKIVKNEDDNGDTSISYVFENPQKVECLIDRRKNEKDIS